jgi:hypothetical protein
MAVVSSTRELEHGEHELSHVKKLLATIRMLLGRRLAFKSNNDHQLCRSIDSVQGMN